MWRPGDDAPSFDADFALAVPNPNRQLPLAVQRQRLPIAKCRESLLYALDQYRTVVVVGETGSGKTTQLPQYLHEAGWTSGDRLVVCTQPRRMAAMTVAARVADEVGGGGVGGVVGYAVRFENYTSPQTRIKFCTDGLLVREALADPLLSRVSVVIVDEAHERSLHTDVLLGLLKKVQRRRPDLRVIVASATMDAELFRDFFDTFDPIKAKHRALKRARDESNDGKRSSRWGNSSGGTGGGKPNEKEEVEGPTATIVSVAGRCHPVSVCYAIKPVADFVRAAAECALQIHARGLQASPGDVLIFLPGMEEVDQCCEYVKERADNSDGLWILPLYASLPQRDQLKVFDRPPRHTRKIVVATTIAETSVTIDGIVYVIDGGFHKLPFFNPQTGVESLITAPVSQASARQRAGRAGRTQPGCCYRLYTEASFHALPLTTPPEIQRASLAWPVLQLKALGVDDVLHFDFVSPPSVASMLHGLEILYSLGALDDQCRLTPEGEVLAEFPLEPRLAKVILSSITLGCAEEAVTVAAMLGVSKDLWLHPRGRKSAKDKLDAAMADLAVKEGDHVTMLNVFRAYEDEALGQGNGAMAREWCNENMVSERALRRAVEVKSQLTAYLRRHLNSNKSSTTTSGSNNYRSSSGKLPSCGDDTPCLLRCLVLGYFAQCARLGSDGFYHTLRGGGAGQLAVELHPSSTLAKFGAPPEFVLFSTYVFTASPYIRDCSRIDGRWLLELAPHFYTASDARGGRTVHASAHVDASSASSSKFVPAFEESSASSSSSRGDSEGGSKAPGAAAAAARVAAREAMPDGASTVLSALPEANPLGRPIFSKPVFKKPAPGSLPRDKRRRK